MMNLLEGDKVVAVATTNGKKPADSNDNDVEDLELEEGQAEEQEDAAALNDVVIVAGDEAEEETSTETEEELSEEE